MSNVYYCPVGPHTSAEEVQRITAKLLDTIVTKEHVRLDSQIPLKVHFGEKGNTSFIKPENYDGIIKYLKDRDIFTAYIETSVIYGGFRGTRIQHEKLAREHGFTQIPIIIADGDAGEDYCEVEINKKNFTSCKIAKAFADYRQLIILSHFKGHKLAGFGGAIKQLGMGHAAKGGKMAMHIGIKPRIISFLCKRCGLCKTRCRQNAINLDGKRPYIDQHKCVGCGACVAICPRKAANLFTLRSIFSFFFMKKRFRERLAEYAYAAQKGKKNIYFNFAMNVTSGCDCEPWPMKPIMDDFGIYVSLDPVAVDQACYDLVKQRGTTFKGGDTLEMAEKIGLGSREYTLIEAAD